MRRRVVILLTGIVLLVVIGAVGYPKAEPFIAQFKANRECCQIPFARNVSVTRGELREERTYYGEIGQDKWVIETMFPDVTDGFFLDVGSGHGTIGSNTKRLEQLGWKGICVDPFPVYMEGRTCQMFKEVVFSEAGREMTFRAAKGLAGLEDTLGSWNTTAKRAPAVQFTTTTLDSILTRGHAPNFVHFVSLDIEGAEYEKRSRASRSIASAWAPGCSSTTRRSPSAATPSGCSSRTATPFRTPSSRTTSTWRRTRLLRRLPRLQLDEVALRITHVGPRNPAGARHHDRFDRADGLPAGGNRRRPRRVHVGDGKRDVAESDAVGGRRRGLLRRVVLKDLERRARGAAARHAIVRAGDSRPGHAGAALQPLP